MIHCFFMQEFIELQKPKKERMKKTKFFAIALLTLFTTVFSSCTKEQIALGLLYGTWNLDEQLDSDGDPVTPAPGVSSVTEITFFRCNEKAEETCTGTQKVTTTITAGSTTTTTISSGDFNYEVFAKSQLIIDGTVFEIETIKKDELKIHPMSQPKATRTYSKK